MKNRRDIQNKLMSELKQWSINQSKNIYADYYLYYTETTKEKNGDILILEDALNTDYQLAGGGKINKGATIRQNFNLLCEVVEHLPILSI